MKKLYQILQFLVLVTLLTTPLHGQVLDPAFHLSTYYKTATITDALQQPDGKWLVAGSFTRANGVAVPPVMRLNADGTVDQGFAKNVIGIISLKKIALLPAGRILLIDAQTANSDPGQGGRLLALNADGTLYKELLTDISSAIVAVQPDGKILVGMRNSGNSNQLGTKIIRLLADGSLDASFDSEASSSTGGTLRALLVQSDGKIVAAGYFSDAKSLPSGTLVARLTADGLPDPNFQVITANNGFLRIVNSLAEQADGKILLGGSTYPTTTTVAAVFARRLIDGTPDPSFVPEAVPSATTVVQMNQQTSGKIVALLDDQKVVQLEADGRLNPSFQSSNRSDNDILFLRLQADDRILLGGKFWNFDGQRRSLALLEPTGTLVAGFAPQLEEPGRVYKIIKLPGGKLLIHGDFQTVGDVTADRLIRLLADGTPDPSFIAYRNADSYSAVLKAVGQADGKIVLSGRHYDKLGTPYAPSLARINADGSADPGFKPALNLMSTSVITNLALVADGRLLVSGEFDDNQGHANLVRLYPNGSFDESFNTVPIKYPVAQIILQADGRIVFANTAAAGAYTTPLLGRLLPDGAADPSFAFVQGLFIAPAIIDLIGIQPNGDILLHYRNLVYAQSEVLYRLTPGGIIDPTFDSPLEQYDLGRKKTGVNAASVFPDGRVVVSGQLKTAQNSIDNTYAVMQFLPNGQPDPNFNPSFFGTVNIGVFEAPVLVHDVVALADGSVLVGGGFTQVQSQPAMGLVKLKSTTITGVRNATAEANTLVYPNPARGQLTVKLSAASKPQSISLLDATGRLVLTQAANQTSQQYTLPHLQAGLYLLRVEYADGPVTRRVVVE